MSTLEQWDEAAKEDIPVRMLTEAAVKYRELRDDYEEKKRISNEAHDKYKQAEFELIDLMERAGQRKHNVPGLGTASTKQELKYTTPKTAEDKRQFYEYIKQVDGKEAADEMMSFNYNSTNRYAKEKAELALDKNEPVPRIPGLSEPTHSVGLVWRKEKK